MFLKEIHNTQYNLLKPYLDNMLNLVNKDLIFFF